MVAIHVQNNEVGLCLTPNTKINCKWTYNLNVKPEPIKLLEENIASKPFDFSLRDYFFDLTLKPKATNTKINKCDYIKLKGLCIEK